MDSSVLTVRDPEIDAAIRGGRPLPGRDIEPAAFAPALPLPFGGGGTQTLASYLDPARAGHPERFLAVDPASSRFTVFTYRAEASGKRSTSLPLPLSAARETSGAFDYSVAAAVSRTAPAGDQLRPVLEAARALETVTKPEDVGRDVVHTLRRDGKLTVSLNTGTAFDFHWLRELAPGRIRGDVGLAVTGGARASVEAGLSGSFLFTAALDGQDRVRVQVYNQRGSSARVPLSLQVAAQMQTPPKEAVQDLAAAFLGVHQLQWVTDFAETARTGIPAWLEAKVKVPAEDLATLLELWRGLDARAAAAIWNAIPNAAEMSALAEWTACVAYLRDALAFRLTLARAIDATPGFAGSAAGLWTEAVAGNLGAPGADEAAFERFRAAAEAASSILDQEQLASALQSLRQYAAANIGLDKVETALNSLQSYGGADAWLRRQIEELWGPVASALDISHVSELVATLTSLAERAYSKAAAAIERKAAAELTYKFETASEETALIDCSFPFTPAGLGLFRQALAGDFRGVLGDDTVLRDATLTHSLRGQTQLELALPLLGRKDVRSAWKSLARVEIEAGENGRLVAYSVDASDEYRRGELYQSALALSGGLRIGGRVHSETAFTLAWTSLRRAKKEHAEDVLRLPLASYGFNDGPFAWVRQLPAGAEIEAAFSLSLPGSCASAWLETPPEKNAAYLYVFSAMSVAVQAAMRRWLPSVYFEDLGRYDDLGAAWPLVMYSVTPPFRARSKTNFTYDFMAPELPGLKWNLDRLRAELCRVQKLLIEAGRSHTATFYSPADAEAIVAKLQRSPQYKALHCGDAFLVDSLLMLAARGREFGATCERDPARAVAALSKFAAGFVKAFHGKLRRLYGGEDFVSFGPLLLVEATAALKSALSEPAPLSAVLRLAANLPDGKREQTFVNAAFRA